MNQLNNIQLNKKEYCNAIAINKCCSIMAAGCDNLIKVFEFNKGILKQVQLLNEHTSQVLTLNFMKRSNHFISGSKDNNIIIWARNQKDQWVSQQKLNQHSDRINCVVLNNNEDIIISGSSDNSIIFWTKFKKWSCSQTIKDHTNSVNGLNLNEDQNKVISCGFDNLVLVIEQSIESKQWIIIQKIKLDYAGVRICFIDNNTFIVQLCGRNYIDVFEMNNSNKQYTRIKDIKLIGGSEMRYFPQQYIKSKCILVNKNSENVSLIRKNQNGEFIVEQSIPFQTFEIYGCMTDDGQYLITWDCYSNEYQIRSFKEI